MQIFSDAFSQTSRVITVNGIVEGGQEKSGIFSFKGIPFAAPPVGDLRWKDPQPVKNWDSVRKATRFGPRAMQPPIFSDMVFRSDGMSEDCLYLNIWTPAPAAKTKLPVLVYFYGGGFVAGDGSEPRYDGENMAQKGIVALTVNYRLGLFGLFAHPDLSAESPHHSSGNYGVMDQMMALKWVKENIAAFGGDPNRITIAGESAGSISVSAQMVSPLAKDLIAGAIGESGSLLGSLPPVALKDAEELGVQFAKAVNATSVKDLRKLTAERLMQAASDFDPFRFAMTIDGYFFPKNPLAIFEAGEQAQIPLLIGWNSQEQDHSGVLGTEKPTKENFENAVRRLYGDRASEVLQAYAATDANVKQVATDLAGDRFIAFSTWRWATLHEKTGKPVYRYYYSHPRPAAVADNNQGRAAGAVHSAEIEYAMGNLGTNKVFAWTDDDYKVSKLMQEYFVNFVKTGNPNGKGLVSWPTTDSSKPEPVMHIKISPQVLPEPHSNRYTTLERILKK